MKQNKLERIPKIIHYCWFGGNSLPEDAKKCIESWRKYCPDYKIIEWNEENFDLSSHRFAREAYEQKKWAFVSDYVRLYVLCNEGGIYLDTDLELIKPLDKFLCDDAFSGFESSNDVAAGIMGCKKGSSFFNKFYDYYKNSRFILENGELNLVTIVVRMTDLCKEYGLLQNNKLQTVKDLTVYPSTVFYPKDPGTGQTRISAETVSIHHYSGSWLSNDRRKRLKLRDDLYERFGNRMGMILYRTVFLPYRVWTFLRARGMGQMLTLIKSRYKNNKRKEE